MQIPPQSEAGGLWTARLRLRFQLKRQHFVQGHVTLKCTASIYSEYFTSTAAIYPGLGLGEKALESRRTNGMSIYCTTTIHCAFIRKETKYESYYRMSLFLQSNQNVTSGWNYICTVCMQNCFCNNLVYKMSKPNDENQLPHVGLIQETMNQSY